VDRAGDEVLERWVIRDTCVEISSYGASLLICIILDKVVE
jgi:hypothetical protein